MGQIEGNQTSEQTRDPADVVRFAKDGVEWAVWHPGDGSQYRVRIVPVVGGPDHADRVLLVSCAGQLVSVQYVDPQVAAYRARPWTAARWNRERKNQPGGFDWWPRVIKPLLAREGAA